MAERNRNGLGEKAECGYGKNRENAVKDGVPRELKV